MSNLRISSQAQQSQLRVALEELEAEQIVLTAKMRQVMREIDEMQRALDSTQPDEESGERETTA